WKIVFIELEEVGAFKDGVDEPPSSLELLFLVPVELEKVQIGRLPRATSARRHGSEALGDRASDWITRFKHFLKLAADAPSLATFGLGNDHLSDEAIGLAGGLERVLKRKAIMQ